MSNTTPASQVRTFGSATETSDPGSSSTGSVALTEATTSSGGRTEEGTINPSTASAGRWTFLTNHSHVLILLSGNPEMVLREVALRVGITERAVQRIIADLEEAGIIVRERVGRQNRYRILAEKPLRHPIESHRSIADLVGLISGKISRDA